jgi:nucleotidyltransferase/DNA polymerase involved in DNA repair
MINDKSTHANYNDARKDSARKPYILHVDGDSFFASCEVSRRPDLRGKPVVVGQERGIASAFTYEAKAIGVTRGMPVFQIKKEFPQVTIIASHFDLYKDYQERLVSILRNHPLCMKANIAVEVYSIDECFAEVFFSDTEIQSNKHQVFLKEIKRDIQAALGITFSFGIAKTKTLAKVASKLNKPDGCSFLIGQPSDTQNIDQVLQDTHIGNIWGIGRETTRNMTSYNILTAKQFLDMPIKQVEKNFSKPISEKWYELHGTPVLKIESKGTDKKSVQSTRSITHKTRDRELLFSELSRNVEAACSEIKNTGLYTNHISVFYRCIKETEESQRLSSASRYDGHLRDPGKGNRSENKSGWTGIKLPYIRYRNSFALKLDNFTQDPSYILRLIKKHEPVLYNPDNTTDYFKSTGITLNNLTRKEHIQSDLFDMQSEKDLDEEYLDVIESIRQKFGYGSILRASSMNSYSTRKMEASQMAKFDVYEPDLPLIYMGEAW